MLSLQTAAPGYLGGTKYWVNAGEVNNKGVDVTIDGQIIQTKDWSWSSTLNASYLKNKVTKMTADEPIIYGEKPAPGTVDPCTIIKEGEAIGTFYGFKWAGVAKERQGTVCRHVLYSRRNQDCFSKCRYKPFRIGSLKS